MIVLKLLTKLWHFKSREFCGKRYIVTCLKIMFLKYNFNIIVKLYFEDIILIYDLLFFKGFFFSIFTYFKFYYYNMLKSNDNKHN